ncbi:MAG: FAD-binding protein [Betaproteobacteria bacterium]
MLEQPGREAWCIYDERLHQLGMTFPDYREANEAGAVRPPPDLPNLKNTLAAVERYASGEKDPFGRDFTTKPKLVPPYYAVKVTGALFHTQGGLVVDTQARVLDRSGKPVSGLFAGGGAACGVSGPYVWGYLSGNGLLTAVTLGRIAGTEAAR